MFTFDLTDKFLTKEETKVFTDYLTQQGLDESIWDVFSSLFRSGTEKTKPFLLKAYIGDELQGAIIIIKCKGYGRALFNNKLLSGLINTLRIPFYLWIRFGCCMDMMSNPGFAKDSENCEDVFKAMLSYLKDNSVFTLINDYTDNMHLYESAASLPALPHAIIDCSSMTTIEDYKKNFKNIKRKIKVFANKNGSYVEVNHKLNDEQITSLKKCFLSTTKNSVFYLPYQDLYLNAALTTSKTELENVYYFIAQIDEEIIGYQAALVTGKSLNALHGAFDRNRKTTYHAYDILFVKMTEFAIDKGLKIIDFGAVINHTKKKMINKSINMSYFMFSKYALVQQTFKMLLKATKIQGAEQMKFRGNQFSS